MVQRHAENDWEGIGCGGIGELTPPLRRLLSACPHVLLACKELALVEVAGYATSSNVVCAASALCRLGVVGREGGVCDVVADCFRIAEYAPMSVNVWWAPCQPNVISIPFFPVRFFAIRSVRGTQPWGSFNCLGSLEASVSLKASITSQSYSMSPLSLALEIGSS